MADVAPTVGLAEIEQKQADRLFKQYRVGEYRGTLPGGVDQQRPVVTMVLLPGLDGLVGHALAAEMHPRHVVG